MSILRELGGGGVKFPAMPPAVKYGGAAAGAVGAVALARGGDGPEVDPMAADPNAPAPPPREPVGAPGYSDLANAAPPAADGTVEEENTIIGGFLGPHLSGTRAAELEPEYHEGDEIALLSSLTTEDLVRLQEQMMAVGLVANPLFGHIDGTKSSGTVGAFRSLLAMSNRSRTDWQSTLSTLAADPRLRDEEEIEQFEPAPYIAPDYAGLAQRVKTAFRERLGRDPDEGELAEFTAHLRGWDKQAFKQQSEVARAQFEGEEPTLGTAVDPLSRFAETFDQVYSGELDYIGDKAEAAGVQETVEESVGDLSAMAMEEF